MKVDEMDERVVERMVYALEVGTVV